jgi:hypothetical protein
MADENQPATKGDLQVGLADLEKRLRAELASKDDLAALEQRFETRFLGLETKMGAMENRLLLEIGHALNVAVEQIGAKVSVLDDKYKDLPARVTVVERDVADLKARLTPPPPPATPKRKAATKHPAPPSRRKKAAR